MSNKALVLLSGGLDSATLLAYLHQKFDSVGTISFSYGQTHCRELEYSRSLATYYKVPHTTLSMPEFFKKTALTGSGKIPRESYSEENLSQTEVPGRNLVFIAIGAAFAVRENFTHVAIAAHSGDHVYPDCRPEFLVTAREAVQLSSNNKIRLLYPFGHLDKSDIVALGQSLGVPFEMTYSCYQGGIFHCGVCPTCRERRQAFIDAGVPDPTYYRE